MERGNAREVREAVVDAGRLEEETLTDLEEVCSGEVWGNCKL